MTVLERFAQGDIRALSKIISHVENHRDGYRELLGRLYRKAGRTLRIGITGPPGAGKSTLVNRLVHEHTDRGRTVGVIAVDPTSPFTGGALLGDRVRMNELSSQGGVYFRSMATRGASGGLASATDNVGVVMEAFGFDVVIIETVGVGQVELDIIDACDVVVVVVVPESGDGVQTLKAGLMEIANIMVVNKADRPGAEKIISELKSTMQMRHRSEDDWDVPVIATEAVNNKNIDYLFGKLGEYVELAAKTGGFERRRRARIKKKILSILKNRFQNEFIDNLMEKVEFDKFVDDIYEGKTGPYDIGDELYQKFCRQ